MNKRKVWFWMVARFALVLLGVLLLASCSSKDAPSLAVPEGAQAGELTG